MILNNLYFIIFYLLFDSSAVGGVVGSALTSRYCSGAMKKAGGRYDEVMSNNTIVTAALRNSTRPSEEET